MKNSTITILGAVILGGIITAGYMVVSPSDREIYESSVLASLHLFALAVGLSGVFLRGIYLRKDLNIQENLNRLFAADNAWGIAAILWIATGLLRAFAGFEKGTEFYMHNPMFHAKLGLFGLAFLLELWPMITFIRWRVQVSKKQTLNFDNQKSFELINYAETIIIILVVFVAGFLARGIFS